jgi:hypothetical protein
VLQRLIYSYVSSHKNEKQNIPDSLNTGQKSNRKRVKRGNIDTSTYMIGHFPGLLYSPPLKVAELS